MAKRRSPTPSTSQVIGQGSGKPGIGLGILETISMTSIINSALPIIRSHFDAVNMVHLLLPRLYNGSQYFALIASSYRYSFNFSASLVVIPATPDSSSIEASLIPRTEPNFLSKAFLRLGPMPGMLSRAEAIPSFCLNL